MLNCNVPSLSSHVVYQNALVLDQRTKYFFYQIFSDNKGNVVQYRKDKKISTLKNSKNYQCYCTFDEKNY